MIIRLSRAVVFEGQAESLDELFVGTLLPMMREQEGLISATVGLPHDGSPREFSMITHCRNLANLKRVAGEVGRARRVASDGA